MALKNLAKAESLMRDLKEKLELRLANAASGRVDTVREARDANGWPMLFLSDGGTETAGNPVIAIRIKGKDAVSKDIFGGAITAAAPHIAELAYELDGTEAEPNRKDIAKVMFELVKTGVRIEIKEIADATAVSESSIDAASAAEDLDNLYWPNKSI